MVPAYAGRGEMTSGSQPSFARAIRTTRRAGQEAEGGGLRYRCQGQILMPKLGVGCKPDCCGPGQFRSQKLK